MQTSFQDAGKQQPMVRLEIQDWLVNQVAGLLYLDPNAIDIQAPFNSYGLSSRDAVMLSGDLEEILNRRLSPTLLYEYPTIASLSTFLSESTETASTGNLPRQDNLGGTISTSTFSSDRAELDVQPTSLDELEALTDEEAEQLLLEKLNKLKLQ